MGRGGGGGLGVRSILALVRSIFALVRYILALVQRWSRGASEVGGSLGEGGRSGGLGDWGKVWRGSGEGGSGSGGGGEGGRGGLGSPEDSRGCSCFYPVRFFDLACIVEAGNQPCVRA